MTNWEKLCGTPEKIASNSDLRKSLCPYSYEERRQWPNKCLNCRFNEDIGGMYICNLRADEKTALEWLQEEAS